MNDPTIKKSLTVELDPAEDIRSVLRWEEKRMGAISRGVLKQALANVEKLQAEANRYRWVRDMTDCSHGLATFQLDVPHPSITLDAAIDAAMSAPPEKG